MQSYPLSKYNAEYSSDKSARCRTELFGKRFEWDDVYGLFEGLEDGFDDLMWSLG